MAKYTNKGLIAYARAMLEYHSPYWYGTYGQIASEALYKEKKRQYSAQYSKWSKESFSSQYGMKVHDCAGLIKGYLMSPCIDANGIVTDPLKPSVYNDQYDWSANMMIQHCSETGDIKTIPEEEGLIVWKDGHVGLYDKNGYVIEERGHSYGTVRTRLADRPFVKWGRLSVIEYVKDPAPSPTPAPSGSISMPTLKKGDKKDEVTLFQICMNDLGYKDQDRQYLEVDGSMGGRSVYVLNLFKADNCLPVNGICDDATWQKILHKRYKEYPKK